MKKIFDKLIKNWILIWFIIAAISLSTMVSFAIYTRTTIAKRVVSTQAGAASLFSSDHMKTGSMKSTEMVTDSTQDVTIPVYVYNYAYPKDAIYRIASTEYELVATLGTLDTSDVFTQLSASDVGLAGHTYSITYTDNNRTFLFGSESGTSCTFDNCTIAGNGPHDNLFNLVFDKCELGGSPNNYCVKIEARPYNNELPVLTGYVQVKYAKRATTGWSGKLEELTSTKDYDGYNYYLEGNGKGKITFRWDPSKVTINKQFLENTENKFYYLDNGDYVLYASAPVESSLTQVDGFVSLTMEVDSIKQNRYEIQFFKTNPSNTEDYVYSKIVDYLPNTGNSDWIPNTTP